MNIPFSPTQYISPTGQAIAASKLGSVAPFERYFQPIMHVILRHAGTTWWPKTLASEIAADNDLAHDSARKYLAAFLEWVETEPEFFPELKIERVGRRWHTYNLLISGLNPVHVLAYEDGKRQGAEGVAASANPYPPGGALAEEWSRGWRESTE